MPVSSCLAPAPAGDCDYAALVMFFSTTTFKLEPRVRTVPPCSGRAKPVDTVRPLEAGVPALTVVPFTLAANSTRTRISRLTAPHWYAKIDSLYDYLVLKAPRNHARLKLFAAWRP